MRVRELIRALDGADPDATILHLALLADASDATLVDDMVTDAQEWYRVRFGAGEFDIAYHRSIREEIEAEGNPDAVAQKVVLLGWSLEQFGRYGF